MCHTLLRGILIWTDVPIVYQENIIIDKVEIQQLPRVEERKLVGYLEHSRLQVSDSGLVVLSSELNSKYELAIANYSMILLGPGTSITSEAMELISQSGVGITVVRPGGTNFLLGARPLTSSASMAFQQAKLWSDPKTRTDVVWKLYASRFDEDFVNKYKTLDRLRGGEGRRVRNAYTEMAKRHKVSWSGRDYGEDADDLNKALSLAHAMAYGVADTVVCALGLIPQLGFIHQNGTRALSLDLADLYKCPILDDPVFELFGNSPPRGDDSGTAVRKVVRETMGREKMVEGLVKVCEELFNPLHTNNLDESLLWEGMYSKDAVHTDD